MQFKQGDTVRVTHRTWLNKTDGMLGQVGRVVVAGEVECMVQFGEEYGVLSIWNENMKKVEGDNLAGYEQR